MSSYFYTTQKKSRRSVLKALLCVGVSTLLPNISFAEEEIRMRRLYNKDLTFSDLAKSLSGKRITVKGFMAPPLKADAKFFVLTKRPMTTCPFCDVEADWPDDILAVYTKRVISVVSSNVPIAVRGVLQLGTFIDSDTGFLSRVRLTDSVYKEV